MPLLMPLLSNKFVWIGLAFAALLAYYNMKVFGLELTVQGLEGDVKSLEVDLRVVKDNFKVAQDVNVKNVSTISEYEKDLNTSKEMQSIIIKGKDKEILTLKRTIKDLRTVDVYPETLEFEECKIKVKRITNDSNETNLSTFSNLLNIGL